MNIKQRKNFTLKINTLQMLTELAEQQDGSLSSIVDIAVSHYYKFKQNNDTDVYDLLQQLNTRMNAVNKDTQIMKEFWNHYFYLNDFDTLASTEKITTIPFKQAEELVNKRIGKQRLRKIDSNN